MPRVFAFSGTRLVALVLLVGTVMLGPVAPPSATAQSEPEVRAFSISDELVGVVAVASLYGFNVAAREDGTVWEWRTYHRPAPNGDPITHGAPAQVEGVSDVIAVATGDGYRLALRADGTVWAWGWNSSGQLGDGTRQRRAEPAPVADLHDIVAVAAGNAHSLALDAHGTVYFWGQGAFGAPYDTLPWAQTIPAAAPGLPPMVTIAARERYGMAIDTEGSVWTWDHGPLDPEDPWIAGATYPSRVAGLDDVVAVAAGSWQHVAIRSDGTVWTWTPYARSAPAVVEGLADVVTVSAGGLHHAALMADGTVSSWGHRWGCGNRDARETRPDLVRQLAATGIVGLAAGDCYTLAVTGPGELLSLPVTERGGPTIAGRAAAR